ncbi:MAG: glycosyl transferase family 1, partial [Verrucomicrobia bacterium]
RAFILTLLLPEMTSRVAQRDVERLASTYHSHLWDAFDQEKKRFRNFMGHNREWLEAVGSEDSHARALWAVGMALGRSRNDGHRNLCALLFQRGLLVVEQFTSPRAWAFVLLAMQEYLRSFSGDRIVNQLRDLLTTRLLELFQANSSKEWQWFEPVATYDNAKLSHAMILSGHWTSRGEVFQAGLQSLRWLVEMQRAKAGHFAPIGSNGFWKRDGERARFDQQPIEAYATISACLEAFSLTHDE